VSLVERDGRVRSFHVPNVTGQTLKPIIVENVSKATFIMTDESPVYPGVGREFAGHNHSAAEGYFSILKRGIVGVYHHVSEAHLHRYLAEFDFRHNNRMALGIDDVERANRALRGVVGKRLSYRTSTAGTGSRTAVLRMAGTGNDARPRLRYPDRC
jgi:hypothetical protein